MIGDLSDRGLAQAVTCKKKTIKKPSNMQPYVTFKCKYIDEDAGLAQLGGFLYKHS